MPEIYTELTDPTAVNVAISLTFTSASTQNLIVGKSSLLQIFTLTTFETELEGSALSAARQGSQQSFDRQIHDAEQEQTFMGGDVAPQRSQREPVTKLVLVAEFPLSGTLISMARIKTLFSKSGGDCLLLAFKDAKLSLVEWDPATYCLSTISLHYYERDEFRSALIPDSTVNYLTADPGSRCAVLKFYSDLLAIIPFRQKEDEDLVLGDADVFGQDDPIVDGGDDSIGKLSKAVPTLEKSDSVPMSLKTDPPWYSSFVVAAAQLDEQISHITSISFLHEYREPTFGILFQPTRTWAGLLECDRKDTHSYIVITLDLEQRASTPIISVPSLPYDLFRIVALPTPIGGALLVGGNQLIHVDQAGKTTGVAVNHFARKTTNFPLTDQSELCLELDGCVVESLEGEGGDLLLITKSGQSFVVSFRLDGRNVSSLRLDVLLLAPTGFAHSERKQLSVLGGRASCLVSLGGRRVFLGSMESDSKVLGWKRRGEKKQGDNMKEEVAANEEDEFAYDDVDDLYGGSTGLDKLDITNGYLTKRDSSSKTQSGSGEYIFQVHDRLINLGPFRDFTLGRPALFEDAKARHAGVTTELELVATSGGDGPEDGALAILRKQIIPNVIGRFDFAECNALWAVRAKKKQKKSGTRNSIAGGTSGVMAGQEDEANAAEEYDRYLIASKAEESLVFKVKDTFEEVKGTEFDSGMPTVDVGTLGGAGRIVQLCEAEVRVYDCDLQLAQIIPMYDDDTGAEPAIVRASFADPYLLLVRNDGSLMVHVCDEQTLEMEEVTLKSEIFKSTSYICGSLYQSKPREVLHPLGKSRDVEVSAFLLTNDGALQVWNLDDTSRPTLILEHFATLPQLLAADTAPSSKSNIKCNVKEILVGNLGDEVQQEPYLIARTAEENFVIYKPFLHKLGSSETLRFWKIPNPRLASQAEVDSREAPKLNRPMVILRNVGGYSAVFVPGPSPSFIIKTSKSMPRVHQLSGAAVRSLSGFHTANAERGFVYVDSKGIVRVCLLPSFNFDNVWSAKKVAIKQQTNALAYHPPMGSYVVSTSSKVPFDIEEASDLLQIDGTHQAAQTKNPLPSTDDSNIKLVSPLTWSVVDQYPLSKNEVALVIKSVELEISEQTKERKQLVAVGSGIFRGEDAGARGAIYVFEIIEVVPEPGRPETNRKLKLVVREEVKGTVSALCCVNGFLLAAQGQKVMVRGLKEDQSLLPVAFMDMNMYVTVAKNLDGMILFGDFMKSITFVGFSEEPFKMTLFGKDVQRVEVMAADFLPDGNQLLFVVADAESNIHILQYDPEHPKSLAGQRLIRRAEFFAGHEIRNVSILPRASVIPNTTPSQTQSQENDNNNESYVNLITTSTGMIASITTIPESLYRRFNIIQNQLISSEEHTAGLNPKAYRIATCRTSGTEILRGVIDGGFLGRHWWAVSEGRRVDLAGKAGTDVAGVIEGLKAIGEDGLGYL